MSSVCLVNQTTNKIMSTTNLRTSYFAPRTYEGAIATDISAYEELRRSTMTCMLFENSFYESGQAHASRIEALCKRVTPEQLVELALEARNAMLLRHAPLFLAVQLARRGENALVASLLPQIIQRADELAEFCALYWKDAKVTITGRRKHRENTPLSNGVKKGLARAFTRFNEYQLAKYNRAKDVKLSDVLRLVHPKPENEAQSALWGRLRRDELQIPDTWETQLSGGADKKATFERLMQEGKLGGLAVLRNLRNMIQAGVDGDLIKDRLKKGINKALPFRFITAARYAPQYEADIEQAMFMALDYTNKLPGKTAIMVDVSGSMDSAISRKDGKSSETLRVDAACGLAMLVRELCDDVQIATFSYNSVVVPNRRGFALRDAIVRSQVHAGTALGVSLRTMQPQWAGIDRLIVITDEQSSDRPPSPWCKHAYVINVATYENTIASDRGWTNISGWSERVIDYIHLYEQSYASK